MSSKSEVYSKLRRSTIIGFIIGFGFWWGSKTVISLFPGLHDIEVLYNIVAALGGLGSVYWIYNLTRMMKFRKELKKDKILCETLNDEYYRHLRLKSFYKSYFVLIILVAAITFTNEFFTKLSVESVINLMLFAAAISPSLFILILDNEKSYE